MNYIEALRKTARKLDAEFESSALISHSPSKGAFREYIVNTFVREIILYDDRVIITYNFTDTIEPQR